MTHTASPPIQQASYSSSNPHYQFGKSSWDYEQGEDRTSVTYPLIAHETKVPQLHRLRETSLFLQKCLELLGEQDLPAQTQIWYYKGRGLERLPSSPESFQKLVELLLNWWSSKTTSAALLSEAQLQQIERNYTFRNDIEVKRVLREYPLLAQTLLDGYSKIEAHFPNSQVFLEVAIDYEASEQYLEASANNEELVISISTSLPPEEAMKTLKEFYNSWWSKVSRDAKEKISIGLEFI
jgi:hypothetical protein